MDVPEGPLLAVQNLPFRLVLLPVDPAVSREKPQREHVWQISGMRHGHVNAPDKEGRAVVKPRLLTSAVETWTDLKLHN